MTESGVSTNDAKVQAPAPTPDKTTTEATPTTYLCEFCGPEKPALQVFACTLCTLNYCVRHLSPMAHYCFGALGKPQTIGVSGQ